MSDAASQRPAHESFGYQVVQRALMGERLAPWENDFARLFWQSLEIHNGGFEQWIGNTGADGALETLEILERHGLSQSHRVTRQAFDVVKLNSWPAGESLYDYLEANIDDWFKRLRPLDEAYWDDADAFDEKLKEIYNVNAEQSAAGGAEFGLADEPMGS